MRYLLLLFVAASIAFGASGCSSGPGRAKPMDEVEPMNDMEPEQEPERPMLSELSLSVLHPQPDPDGRYTVEEGGTFEVAVLASPAPEEALEIQLAVEVPEHLKAYVRETFQATDSDGKLAILLTLDAMSDRITQPFELPDDPTDRADATFTAELVRTDHYTLSEDRSATITITDNDEPTTTTTTTTPPPPPPQTRTLSHDGTGTITWGDADGPPTDGSLTKVTLTGLTGLSSGTLPRLEVDRGGAASCTMEIDGSENPGSGNNPPAGQVRLSIPGATWNNYSNVVATFDANGDQVRVSERNGATAKMDIRVLC